LDHKKLGACLTVAVVAVGTVLALSVFNQNSNQVAFQKRNSSNSSRYETPPNEWHSPPKVSIGQGFGVKPYDYVIFQGSEGDYYAMSGDNGRIMYEGSNASTVIQNAVDSLSRGTVYLKGFDRPSGVTTTENVSIFSQSNGNISYTNSKIGGAKIGLISDLHWNTTGGGTADDVVPVSELKANLDTFIGDMNENFKPEYVIVMGDIADGNQATDFADLKNWENQAKNYLEDNLSAKVLWLMGNHEYTFADSVDMTELYSIFGWDGLSDTWKAVDIGGVRLLLLNTGYGSGKGSHKMPSEELDWLRSQVETCDQKGIPFYTFMHVPASTGAGAYDGFTNEENVKRVLNGSSSYMGNFFGHVHHDNGWDRLRTQRDTYGQIGLHICTPNLFVDNHSPVPYAKLTLRPDGRASVEASYDNNLYPTVWKFPYQSGRTGIVDRVFARKEMTPFESLDGYFTSGTVSVYRGTAKIQADNVAGSESKFISNPRIGPTDELWSLNFDTSWAIKVGLTFDNVESAEYYAAWGRVTATDETYQHIGIRVENETIYGSVGNGTAETTENLASVTGNGNMVVWIFYDAGEMVRYYIPRGNLVSKGNKLVGTISSGLPSGTDQANRLVQAGAYTYVDEYKTLEVYEWAFMRPRKNQPFRISRDGTGNY